MAGSNRRRKRKIDIEGLLGPLESSVMEILWSRGSSTVTELTDLVNDGRPIPLSYKTILTICTRLDEKGILDHEQVGRAFRYWPVLNRSDFVADQADKAADKMIDQFGELAISSFVDRVAANAKQLKALQDLLELKNDDEA